MLILAIACAVLLAEHHSWLTKAANVIRFTIPIVLKHLGDL
ncbi:hypothetical protein [Micromonospora craniellae]|nr:hypothetical protein [Micromonospora craniellae]